MDINCLLFDGFETLDLFGAVAVFSKVNQCNIRYFSIEGGTITSAQKTRIITDGVDVINVEELLLIPGGRGTRALVNNVAFIESLKGIAEKARWCLTVCTGSALLAKTGLLDRRRATTNKMAFHWVKGQRDAVDWVGRARWVIDQKYYTSSGISAGIDMSLGFVKDQFGEKQALEVAKILEYEWKHDKDDDPFAV